jgi:hypothetical protein
MMLRKVEANKTLSALLGFEGYDMAHMCKYDHKGGPNAEVWMLRRL